MIAQRATLRGVRAAAVIECRAGVVLPFDLNQQAATTQGIIHFPNIPIAGRIEASSRRAADSMYHIAPDEQLEDFIAEARFRMKQ